jgi:tetratricopeptide (TPR) repeat protein
MARNHLYNLARGVLAVGLFLFSSGCGSFEMAAPNSTLGWNQDARRERITPAKQADVQIALARVAESQGDLDGAEQAYRAALSRDKKRGDAHLHLANLQTLKGAYRQATEEYQKALEVNPGNADVFCDMGYSLYLQHKWDEASRNLKQALAINPDHQRAHNNLGLVYAHLERTEEALAEFRKAGSSAAEAHLNLAFSLSLDQRWKPAREEYRRALAASPNSETVKSRLRELDHLLASIERRTPHPRAIGDSQMVPVSAQSSTSRPNAALTTEGGPVPAPRIKIPPPAKFVDNTR